MFQQMRILTTQPENKKKKGTQPKTRKNIEDYTRVYHQNVNGIKSGGK